MALYIPHSIFHLARLLYVRPENLDPTMYDLPAKRNYFPDSIKEAAGLLRHITSAVF